MTGHRLLYALRPPLQVRGQIGWQRDQLGLAESLVANDRLHLTLAITDDFADQPYQAAARMRAIGETIAAAPVPVRLDRLSASNASIALRPSRRIAALSDLGAALCARLAQAALLRRDWRFSPHVTLLYRSGSPFTRPIPPLGWDATDFVLIHSVLGATRHIELGRWPLEQLQSGFGF